MYIVISNAENKCVVLYKRSKVRGRIRVDGYGERYTDKPSSRGRLVTNARKRGWMFTLLFDGDACTPDIGRVVVETYLKAKPSMPVKTAPAARPQTSLPITTVFKLQLRDKDALGDYFGWSKNVKRTLLGLIGIVRK